MAVVRSKSRKRRPPVSLSPSNVEVSGSILVSRLFGWGVQRRVGLIVHVRSPILEATHLAQIARLT